MQPWVLIDTAPVPGGSENLRLMQRGTDFFINLGTALLMGSRMRGSEQALATLGCSALQQRGGAGRILIGGLGMGFTLRAALDMLGPSASVEVAEIVPAVIRWGQGPLSHLSGDATADPRVAIETVDVGRKIRASRSLYDAILLDVDNGPSGLTRKSNDGLYGDAGLRAAWAALRGEGALAIWSAFPDRTFGQRLAKVGFDVKEHSVRAQGAGGSRHVIWVATRPNRGA